VCRRAVASIRQGMAGDLFNGARTLPEAL
jgi:hypothetical protein